MVLGKLLSNQTSQQEYDVFPILLLNFQVSHYNSDFFEFKFSLLFFKIAFINLPLSILPHNYYLFYLDV